MDKPSVFKYLDFRCFLRDMFSYGKERRSSFSHRSFAQKAGFSSPSFLQLVMTGKRNLTSGSISKIAAGFSLSKREHDYFELLVFMNQAKAHEERNRYYKKMMSMKGGGETKKLAEAQYEYYSNWFYPVIREVVAWGNAQWTPEKVAAALNPRIKPKEAEKALELLQKLKMIKLDKEGRWKQTDTKVTTGPEVKSLVLRNYHKEMIKLASESIERHPATERDITSVTVSVSSKTVAEIKDNIAAVRKKILDLAANDQNPDKVIQINIQIFPLAHRSKP